MLVYPTLSQYKTAVGPFFDTAVLDPKLKDGRVKENKRREPLSYAGGFSIVFPIDVNHLGKSKTFALRCWKKELKDGRKRYQEIDAFLEKRTLPYFVDFQYVPNSIRVNGVLYPTTRMEWVEGENLCKFVERNLGKPTIFRTVADKFATMVKDLHVNKIAHGDLQSGNILLLQNGTDIKIKLIDYDSLYVPTLGNQPDRIVGLPEYQHPQRIAGKNPSANEKLDYFSELVIYLSFRSLAEEPALWRRFVQNVDKRLIFSADDFKNPKGSKIFQKLDKMSTEVKQLALTLKTFCEERSINNLKRLEDVLPSSTSSSSFSSKAISKGPPTARHYYNQGMRYLHGEQFSHAVQQLKLAINLKSDYKEAYYARGLAHWKMQQLKPAKKALEKALKISPSDIETKKLLKEIENQIQWIKRSLKNYCQKAEEFCKHGNLKAAKNEVEKALRIDRNYKPARDLLEDINRRNSSPYRQQKPVSTRKTTVPPPQASTAPVKKRDSKEGLYKKATDFYNQGSLEKAKDMAEKALNLDRNYQSARKLLKTIQLAYNKHAETYTKKGQDDKALAAYKEVIKIGKRLG